MTSELEVEKFNYGVYNSIMHAPYATAELTQSPE